MNKKISLSAEKKIFTVFSLCILLFFVFCTRLLIKTDDGHFLGIAANEGFTVAEWLKSRYETISGRTTGEFLVMTFLKIPVIFWKLLACGCCIFTVRFLCKISDLFGNAENKLNRTATCCCMIFLIGIGALNPGAFWYSGSFTYLVPCSFMLLTLSPAIFNVLDIKVSHLLYFSAFPAAIIAVSQEQSAVCTCCFFAVIFIISLTQKKLKAAAFLPFIPSLTGTLYLLFSPGAQNRNSAQATGSFSSYADFGTAQKLVCGFTNYFGYSFFTSVFVTLFFAGLVCLLFFQTSDNKCRAKKIAAFVFAYFVAVCGILNILCFAVNRTSFDKLFQKCFQNGNFNAWFYIGAAVCFAAIAILFFMLVKITLKDKSAGLMAGLFACSAIGCGIMPGFSSSVYDSGQRVFFFTDVLMLIACIILYSRIKSKKTAKILKYICAAVSLAFFVFDIFTFTLMEIPVMG